MYDGRRETRGRGEGGDIRLLPPWVKPSPRTTYAHTHTHIAQSHTREAAHVLKRDNKTLQYIAFITLSTVVCDIVLLSLGFDRPFPKVITKTSTYTQ